MTKCDISDIIILETVEKGETKMNKFRANKIEKLKKEIKKTNESIFKMRKELKNLQEIERNSATWNKAETKKNVHRRSI